MEMGEYAEYVDTLKVLFAGEDIATGYKADYAGKLVAREWSRRYEGSVTASRWGVKIKYNGSDLFVPPDHLDSLIQALQDARGLGVHTFGGK